jgi:hypothetical protein
MILFKFLPNGNKKSEKKTQKHQCEAETVDSRWALLREA